MLSEVVFADYIFEATVTQIGEAEFMPDQGVYTLADVGYPIRFADVDPIVNFGGVALVDDVHVVSNSFYEVGGEYRASGTVDTRELAAGDHVIVMARAMPADFPYDAVVGTMVRDAGGDAQILGNCAGMLIPRARAVATSLGFDNSFDLIRYWAEEFGELGPDAILSGEQPAELVAAEAAAIDAENPSGPNWADLDPLRRSLRPGDVPPEVSAMLDVRGAVLDVAGVPADQFVAVRTQSGVSGGAGSQSEAVTLPAFFLPGDTAFEVVIGPAGDSAAGRVVATLALEQFVSGDAAGFRVGGTADEVTVEVLDREAMAAALGVDVSMLENIRLGMLATPDFGSVPPTPDQ